MNFIIKFKKNYKGKYLITRRSFIALFGSSHLLANNIILSDNDIFIHKKDWNTFIWTMKRLKRLRKYIGYGNFNVISFSEALNYANKVPIIGKFTKKELRLLDMLFYEDPKKYGFYGKRINANITDTININEIVKVKDTGHYLYKGEAFENYNKIIKDIGNNIILTSGVRGIVKQMSLYMKKIYSLNGNISEASSSLAPPGYTYHSIGDFDVGKKGFGSANFTEKFTTTEEYNYLKKLNYISMRYTKNNNEGVRYEPWHVKVI